jgi:hypothetical protein
MSDVAAEKRAKWRAYFEQRITGGDAEVNAATDAAMHALEGGGDANAIINAGLEGAKTFRRYGNNPPPSRQAQSRPAQPTASPRAATAPLRTHTAPPQQAARTTPAAPASAAVGSASSGIVSNLQQRQEMAGRTYFTVWSFRLERTDSAGRVLTPIQVEMRGKRFRGAVNPGDLVDIGRRANNGGLVRTQRVHNHTIGADVVAKGKRHPVLAAFGTLLVIGLFAAWVLFILSKWPT